MSGNWLLRTVSWLGLLLLLAGCTNSKLLVGPFYNQLDDKIRSEFNELGDFSPRQTDAFEQAVGTFHVWHRQSELPKYAGLLQEIASSIKVAERTSDADVERWVGTAEEYTRAARQCYPANFLAGTARTLTDGQLNAIEKRFKNQRRKNRARYAKRSPQERVAFRLKNIEKWAGRINLQLTQAQRSAIRSSLSRQISLRSHYHTLSDVWNRQLFTLARKQESEDYEAQLQSHLGKLWTLLESAHPDEWQANRQLLQETLLAFIQSMTAEQRRNSSRWLGKMGATLHSVSQDTPSFTPGNDPSVGCLVQNDSLPVARE